MKCSICNTKTRRPQKISDTCDQHRLSAASAERSRHHQMTPPQVDPKTILVIQLKKLHHSGDQEIAHCEAERRLMEYLRATNQTGVADAYEACREAVGFWYA